MEQVYRDALEMTGQVRALNYLKQSRGGDFVDQSSPYGVGDFLYTDLGSGRTHITWTYSFKLKEDRFPGYLGAFGRYLFRVGFLDHQYAAMMRGTLDGTKANAEQ